MEKKYFVEKIEKSFVDNLGSAVRYFSAYLSTIRGENPGEIFDFVVAAIMAVTDPEKIFVLLCAFAGAKAGGVVDREVQHLREYSGTEYYGGHRFSNDYSPEKLSEDGKNLLALFLQDRLSEKGEKEDQALVACHQILGIPAPLSLERLQEVIDANAGEEGRYVGRRKGYFSFVGEEFPELKPSPQLVAEITAANAKAEAEAEADEKRRKELLKKQKMFAFGGLCRVVSCGECGGDPRLQIDKKTPLPRHRLLGSGTIEVEFRVFCEGCGKRLHGGRVFSDAEGIKEAMTPTRVY